MRQRNPREPLSGGASTAGDKAILAIAAAVVIVVCSIWFVDRSTAERLRLELQLRHAAEHAAIDLDARIALARLVLAELTTEVALSGIDLSHRGSSPRPEKAGEVSVSLLDSSGRETVVHPGHAERSEGASRSSSTLAAWTNRLLRTHQDHDAPGFVGWDGDALGVAHPIEHRAALKRALVAVQENAVTAIEARAVAEGGAGAGRIAILDRDGRLLAGGWPSIRGALAPGTVVLPAPLLQAESGIVQGRPEGEKMWIAYSRTRLANWVVAFAVPSPSLLLSSSIRPVSVAGTLLLLLAGTALLLGRASATPGQHAPAQYAQRAMAASPVGPPPAQAEATHREILRDMGECFIALDRAGRILEFNPRAAAWAKEIGGDLQAFVGRPFREAVPRTHASWFWGELSKVLETRSGAEFDLHSAIRPGTCLEFRLFPTEAGCSIFIREVTRWRAAEHSLDVAQKVLQSTIDALSASIVILDRDGMIVRANRAWRHLMEQSHCRFPEHGIGTRYASVYDACRPQGSATEPLAIPLGAILAGTRRALRMDCEWPVADGFRLLQVRASRFDHGDGIQLIVVHDDVSEMQQATNVLQRVTESLLKSQEDERRRIARELHDSTAQHLVAAKMMVDRIRQKGALSDGNATFYPDEIDAMLDRALSEIRSTSYLLHPPLLDHAGLQMALRSYVSGFAKRSGLDIALEIPSRTRSLPQDAETALFRVAQEALANIHRHSGSATARVHLRFGRSRAILQIEDDGKGFTESFDNSPADDLHKVGVGIPGMRARMRQLGGTLTVKSSVRGTVVRAAVPLKS